MTGDPDDDAAPTELAVVEAASDAAEGVVFSRYDRSEIRDLDVAVRFEEGVLSVDVYLDAPSGPADPDPELVADDAALAARSAVDELFAATDEED